MKQSKSNCTLQRSYSLLNEQVLIRFNRGQHHSNWKSHASLRYVNILHVNTVVVDDINICVIYRIKVVLLNNEDMESQTTTYAYHAPAGRKYISQF